MLMFIVLEMWLVTGDTSQAPPPVLVTGGMSHAPPPVLVNGGMRVPSPSHFQHVSAVCFLGS